MRDKRVFIPVHDAGEKKLAFTEPGTYAVFFHNFSGEISFDILVAQVSLHIFGLYTGRNKDRFRLSTLQKLIASSSSSDLLVKGVFHDSSQFVYEGLIRIEKEGNGSHAYQKNQNLLLSEDVFVSSKPDLEILANDVFCTHGSTTGRPNEKQAFYLETRGLSKKEAERAVVSGFIQDLFRKIDTLGFGRETKSYKQAILKLYA